MPTLTTFADNSAVDFSTTWITWNDTASTGNTADTTWAVWSGSTTAGTTATLTVDVAGNTDGTNAWVAWSGVLGEQVAAYKEARKARKKREREARRRAKQVQRAKAKAEMLLHENLTDEQRHELREYRYFTVHSKDRKRVYRVHRGTIGNVEHVDDEGQMIAKYCVHPCSVPEPDVMLAQKLHLEHDDQEVLKIANLQAGQRVA